MEVAWPALNSFSARRSDKQGLCELVSKYRSLVFLKAVLFRSPFPAYMSIW